MENDSTFVAPEGVYSMTEEHKHTVLITAATAGPASYPSRLSSVTIRFPAVKQAAGPVFAQLLGGGSKESKKDKNARERKEDDISASSSETPDDNHSGDPSSTQQDSINTPVTPNLPGDAHNLFSPPASNARKKTVLRPPHNLKTTSSSFITRQQSAENLAKTLQSRQGENTFVFYNSGKSFLWIDIAQKSKDPLARITFSANPTCHDINNLTASHERLEVIIGFSSGDIIWFDAIGLRYGRLNKQGSITSSPCTSIRWVPTSTTLFMVSHADGTIIVYDKTRDDGVFTPTDPAPGLDSPIPNSYMSNSTRPSTSNREWDFKERMHVSYPPWHPAMLGSVSPGGKAEKDKVAKNPVSHWKVSNRNIVDMVFSPDVKYIAAISDDGCLRVIDALSERLVDCYGSYFGAFTCVAWSPDGRFILTGGQDDLLTIISPWEQRVIARCQGHSSFVTAVAFDEIRCDGRTYRFGSVGEDNKIILWDFSSGAIHRSKHQATHHQRMSMSSTVSLGMRRGGSVLHLPSSPGFGDANPPPKYHPAPSRNEVSVVQPVLVKTTDADILTSLAFTPRAVVTTSRMGHVKVWVRPLAVKTRHHIKNRDRSYSVDIRDLIA